MKGGGGVYFTLARHSNTISIDACSAPPLPANGSAAPPFHISLADCGADQLIWGSNLLADRLDGLRYYLKYSIGTYVGGPDSLWLDTIPASYGNCGSRPSSAHELATATGTRVG